MTIALWCVMAAGLLPYLWSALAKSGAPYDNAQPRLTVASGWRQRANWAQHNAWEAFAPFAAGVLAAHWLRAPQLGIDALAGLFIAFRLAHGAAYLANRASLRSVCWLMGVVCIIGLYVLAARTA